MVSPFFATAEKGPGDEYMKNKAERWGCGGEYCSQRRWLTAQHVIMI